MKAGLKMDYIKNGSSVWNNMNVKNISEYVNLISEYKKAKEEEHARRSIGGVRLWYRGQDDEYNEELRPKIYRFDKMWESGHYNIITEDNMRKMFINKGHLFRKSNIELTIIDWYLLMQHYGMPTRLLDWSESPLIALYFALRSKKNTNPIIWAINAYEVNYNLDSDYKNMILMSDINLIMQEKEFKKDAISKEVGKRKKPILYDYFDSNLTQDYPCCIYPKYFDQRMIVQKSCFTLFGKLRDGITELAEDNKISMLKITIKKNNKKEMLSHLKDLGIGDTTVFPDLEGLSNELISQFEIE